MVEEQERSKKNFDWQESATKEIESSTNNGEMKDTKTKKNISEDLTQQKDSNENTNQNSVNATINSEKLAETMQSINTIMHKKDEVIQKEIRHENDLQLDQMQKNKEMKRINNFASYAYNNVKRNSAEYNISVKQTHDLPKNELQMMQHDNERFMQNVNSIQDSNFMQQQNNMLNNMQNNNMHNDNIRSNNMHNNDIQSNKNNMPFMQQTSNMHNNTPLMQESNNLHNNTPLMQQTSNMHNNTPLMQESNNMHSNTPLMQQSNNMHNNIPSMQQTSNMHRNLMSMQQNNNPYSMHNNTLTNTTNATNNINCMQGQNGNITMQQTGNELHRQPDIYMQKLNGNTVYNSNTNAENQEQTNQSNDNMHGSNFNAFDQQNYNQFMQYNYNPNLKSMDNNRYLQMPPQNKQQYYNQQRYNQQMYQNYVKQMYNQGYNINHNQQQLNDNEPIMTHVNNLINTQNNTINNSNVQKQNDIFNLKNIEHEDPYKEYIHESPIPQKITQKKKKVYEEDESTTTSTSSSDDDSECVESSSTGEEEEEMPKKRGRPRKTTQQVTYQMPYNPYIQPPLGNQYQPSYRPMMYKPVHPFNPNNPRYPGDYRTKHMRNVSGSNASSYNAIFNMQMHKNGYFPPNMYPQQPMMYHPGMYLNNVPLQRANGQEGSVYGYARTPNVGRPRSVNKREAPTSPLIRKKRKSAIQNMIKKIEIDEDVTEETNEEEQDPVEKLLKKREDDFYLVKFRHKSYLHCDWVHKDEIGQTKGGLIKVKRFRQKEEAFDPDFIKVEKVYHEDFEDFEVEQGTENSYMSHDGKFYIKKKIYLIKWKKMSHELSTFEYEEKVKDLEGFKEEYQKMLERKKISAKKFPIEWRPQRDQFIRFNTSPKFKNDNTLRAYQLEGLNWLLNRWFYKQGCIMADEMGLGKTVQSVTFINTLFTRYECGPVLIVAPLSTIPHWEREFEAWSDLRVTTYHGSIQGRDIIYSYEMISRDDRSNYLFDVLITTYEMVMSGLKHLENIKFSVGIFDEAHRLKNSNSKAVQALKNIYFNHKVLLSGTPLQNNLQELWSLLNFIDPIRYSSAQYFLEEFKLEKSEDVERLQNLLKPLMLRRMKDDVEKSIPVKEETIIEVELTMIQKKFYRAILEKNLEFLRRGEKAPNLGNIMVELRKCCIHPYLIAGAEEKIISEYKVKQKRQIEEYKNIESLDEDNTEIEVNNGCIDVNDGCVDVNNEHVDVNNERVEVNNHDVGNFEDDENLDEQVKASDNNNTNSDNSIKDDSNNINENVVGDGNNANKNIAVYDNIIKKSSVNNPPTNAAVNISTTIAVNQKTSDFNFFGLTYDEYYKVLIQSSGKLVLLDKLLAKLKGKHKILIFSQMTTCLNLLSEYLVYRNYKYERIDGGVRADHRQAAIDRFSLESSDIFVFLLCTRAGGVGINLTAADTVVIFDSDWNPQNDLQAQARCHRIGQKNEVKIYRLVTRNSYEREMFDKAGLKLGLDRAVLQKMSFEGDKKMKKNAAIEMLLKKGAYGVLMENDDVNSKFCEEDIESILERRTKVVKHLDSGNIFSKASFQVDEEVDDPHFWENLLSKKKSEADEGKIKRQVRRLARGHRIENEEVDKLIEKMEKELEKFENEKIYRKVKCEEAEECDNEKVDSHVKVGEDANSDYENGKNEKDNKGNVDLKVDDVKSTGTAVTNAEADNVSIGAVTIGTVSSSNEYASDIDALNYTEKFALLVFLTVLKKGTHALQTLKNTKNTHKILSMVVKFCTEKIESKQRDDFTLHMDHLLKEPFEKEVFVKYASLYDKYYETFLLRVQIVLILTYLTKKSDLTSVERGKQFTYEDDKRIVNWVLTYGYDNFPSSIGREKGAFKGKNSNELNQRLRKIVMGLNKKNEDEDETGVKEDIERECLFLFGRVCDENRESIKKWFKERVNDNRGYEEFEDKLNEIVEDVTCGKNKRGGSEIGLHKRIILFDNLRRIDELPVIKKSHGLTRRWNQENDSELREFVLVNGLKDEIMGIGMDAAIKRLHLLVDNEKQ